MDASLAITDFPDRISPMVVKELRQGLRTNLFVGVMAVLHALLVLLTLISGSSGNAATAGAWFDGLVTLVLCIILPLRGFSAMADELKAGTLDMLVLTRLSSGRIIFGKWASLMSQSLLVALSILPYVAARYLFGGVDLFGEMLMLFYKWLAGAVVAAAVIALSTQRQFWLRALVVGLPLLIGGCGMISYAFVSILGPSAGGPSAVVATAIGSASGWLPLLATAGAAWLIFYFLTLGATRTAPAASLLSVLKRSVHLGVFATLILLGVTTPLGAGAAVAGSWMLSLVMMDALTEHANEVPSVYAAFYRRGWLGHLASWLLAPGWVTGFVFTLLLVGLQAGAVAWASGTDNARLLLVGVCGTWMVGALVHCLPTSRKARDLLLPFLCYWLATSVAFTAVAGLMMAPLVMKSATPWYACALPAFVPTGYAAAQAGDKDAFLRLATLAALVWPAVLLIAAALAWRRTHAARQEAWRMVATGEGGAAAAA